MAPKLKRVYEPVLPEDGTRILVDRLWPRGISREAARIDCWLRGIAPSTTLRKQFHGKPEAWDAFCCAYANELACPEAADAIAELAALMTKGRVTLLYAARNEERNNAAALLAWLERQRLVSCLDDHST